MCVYVHLSLSLSLYVYIYIYIIGLPVGSQGGLAQAAALQRRQRVLDMLFFLATLYIFCGVLPDEQRMIPSEFASRQAL